MLCVMKHRVPFIAAGERIDVRYNRQAEGFRFAHHLGQVAEVLDFFIAVDEHGHGDGIRAQSTTSSTVAVSAKSGSPGRSAML